MRWTSRLFCSVALVGICFYATAAAQTEVWVARVEGEGANAGDAAHDVAVDTAGNIYVVGRLQGEGTDFDFATIKYNQAGELQWLWRFDGPSHGADSAVAVALDGDGNIYVTGASDLQPFIGDIVTIKYSPAGEVLWRQAFDGPPGLNSEPTAIAIGANNDIFVTGVVGTDIFKKGGDYITIAYNSAGRELWSKTYDGPAQGSDFARAVALDAAGNIYVTGESDGGENEGLDFATIKYTPAGQQAWVRRHNGRASGVDRAVAMAVDDAGNVHVTGVVNAISAVSDYVTIKYDTQGATKWIVRFSGEAARRDEPAAIALDTAGNVLVTGGSQAANGRFDYATVKYNAAGGLLWVARYNGPRDFEDSARDVKVDARGNVFVTGGSWGDERQDYATLKYSSAGAELWVARYQGPSPMADIASAMTLDSAGRIIVTGKSHGDRRRQTDFATLLYSEGTPGDLNCDGSVDLVDVGPFITALLDPSEYEKQYPDCDINNADINIDGSVDLKDVEPFIELLLGP